ncbi:hypothetical protein [Salinisphaera orenii]|uniref:hypothetical protein n=1 Tax=Salinisphaera orenii TaxID=856731 RepID=UPI000DBE6834
MRLPNELENRVPADLVGVPGDGLDAATRLLEVLAATAVSSEHDAVETPKFQARRHEILRLAQDLIAHDKQEIDRLIAESGRFDDE